MSDVKKYMVTFEMPYPFPQELYAMIPEQREAVEQLFGKGCLVSYTLAQDRSRLWAIFRATAESELVAYIDSLPMTMYCDYNYHEIMFHDTVTILPAISMN